MVGSENQTQCPGSPLTFSTLGLKFSKTVFLYLNIKRLHITTSVPTSKNTGESGNSHSRIRAGGCSESMSPLASGVCPVWLPEPSISEDSCQG